MNGRNHVICNLATLGSLSIADGFVVRDIGNHTPTFFESGVLSINNWVLDGNEVASFYTIVALALFILGSLLPDIDSKTSTLGRWLYIPVEHRTWLHALYVPIILFIASIWIRPLFWLGFGYLLHLFYDSLSTCGICWFYPYPGYVSFEEGARVKKNHKIKLYKTNSTSETGVCAVVVAIFISFLFWAIYDGLVQ